MRFTVDVPVYNCFSTDLLAVNLIFNSLLLKVPFPMVFLLLLKPHSKIIYCTVYTSKNKRNSGSVLQLKT